MDDNQRQPWNDNSKATDADDDGTDFDEQTNTDELEPLQLRALELEKALRHKVKALQRYYYERKQRGWHRTGETSAGKRDTGPAANMPAVGRPILGRSGKHSEGNPAARSPALAVPVRLENQKVHFHFHFRNWKFRR